MVEIEKLTLKELVADRPDLTQAIKNGEDEGTAIVHIKKDKKKRTEQWTEEKRDLNGILISKRIDEYTYYETGEVDVITQQVYNGKGLISKRKVKHFTDGRRPEVAEVEKCQQSR